MDIEIEKVGKWLDDVVIGLNLCPFAAKPRRSDQVRIITSSAEETEALLTELYKEIKLLSDTPPEKIETSLIIIPNFLADFDDYNQFLDLADELLLQFEWDGVFQVASFHPDYCFADVAPDSVENLTNRSPYPILHIIREASIEKAVESITDPEEIYKRNIKSIQNLSKDQIKQLFYYL